MGACQRVFRCHQGGRDPSLLNGAILTSIGNAGSTVEEVSASLLPTCRDRMARTNNKQSEQ